MIVIDPALVSSPPADEPLNYPTLGWHNVVSAGNVSASSSDALYPITNIGNPATHLYWQASAASPPGSDEYIDINAGGVTVDYVGIAGHNFGTAGIAVTIEDGTGGTYLIANGGSPPDLFDDDAPIIFRFAPGAKNTIRIRLTAGTATPRVAVIYVGKLTIFERGTQGGYTPLTYGLVNNVVNGESESGNFLGRIVTGARVESTASFKWLSPTWYRQNLAPFVAASVNNPFFFAWEPVDYPLETGYAWLATDPKPIIDLIGYFHIDLEMTGIVS
jgi:hypothetical protein